MPKTISTTPSHQSPQPKKEDLTPAVARFELMLDAIKTRHVCDGWSVDAIAGDRALKYLRKIAAGGRERASKFDELIQFVADHGQSLDWIFRGDLVVMICHAAAHSPRALRSVEDGVFAVIAEHRAAVAAYVTACKAAGARSPAPKLDAAAADARVRATGDREQDLLAKVLNSEPTTLAGVAALLDHLGLPDFLDEEEGRSTMKLSSRRPTRADLSNARRRTSPAAWPASSVA